MERDIAEAIVEALVKMVVPPEFRDKMELLKAVFEGREDSIDDLAHGVPEHVKEFMKESARVVKLIRDGREREAVEKFIGLMQRIGVRVSGTPEKILYKLVEPVLVTGGE